MKIAVLFKWAANSRDARIGGDGAVDWQGTRGVVSAYDQAAIEVGRRLADENGGEVVGVTAVGEPMAATDCRAVIAHGLDRLIMVTGGEPATADPTTTGLILAGALASVGLPDLVLAGEASLDLGAGLVPAVTAGVLGWPMIDQVLRIRGVPGGIGVVRRTLSGEQSLHLTGPAVCEIQRYAVTPRVPGLRASLEAAKRPVSQVGVAELAVELPTPVTVTAQAATVAPSRAQRRLRGDPRAAARELVSALREQGVLP